MSSNKPMEASTFEYLIFSVNFKKSHSSLTVQIICQNPLFLTEESIKMQKKVN